MPRRKHYPSTDFDFELHIFRFWIFTETLSQHDFWMIFFIFTTVQILVRGGLTMPRPYIVDLTFYQKMTKPVKILQRSAKNYAPNALVVKCALLILPDLDKSLLRFLPDLLNSVWLQLWVDNPNKGSDQPALRYSTTIEAQLPMITWKKDKCGVVNQDASRLVGSWGIFMGPADVFV